MIEFEVCLEAAKRIVQAEKDLYPHSEGVVALKVSGGVSNTDSAFQRQGTTQQEASYSLPSSIMSLLSSNAQSAAPNSALSGGIGSLLHSLVSQDPNAVPSKASLDTILGLSPTSFDGAATLRTIAGRNPYSSQFEDQTAESFKNRAGTAMAQVQSGPSMVRGGTARPAIAQAEMATRLGQERGTEVRNAQQQDAGQVFQASQLLNLIENARRGLQLQAQGSLAGQAAGRTAQSIEGARTGEMQKGTNIGLLQLASNMLGSRKSTTTDDLTGKGTENRSFVQGEGGLSCCFIFLSALNGGLPWYVNKARKELLTPARKAGYRWMSSILVPLMERHSWVKKAVNVVIVKPFLRYGASRYGDTTSKLGYLFAPYCHAWLAGWSLSGKLVLRGN